MYSDFERFGGEGEASRKRTTDEHKLLIASFRIRKDVLMHVPRLRPRHRMSSGPVPELRRFQPRKESNTIGSSISYSASKAGLINLTRNLARALAPEVRVNAVAPGVVDSEWTRTWPKEAKQAAADHALLKRISTPHDIADCLLVRGNVDDCRPDHRC
jgi:NAD(P)-dependent dehydrogenase (short-subunit alcohol dehydrogenase family)